MSAAEPVRAWRLAVLNSHPIQYFGPLYRRLAQEPSIDLVVYYCSRQGLDAYADAEFGETLSWDVPLLDGYTSRFLPNWRRRPPNGMLSLVNPGIVSELAQHRYDALWLHGHRHCTNLLALLASRLLGIPVMMRGETHLGLRRSASRRRLRGPIMRLLYAQCRAFLTIGSRNTAFYRSLGIPDERLFSVPYSVDNERFVAQAQALAGRTQELRAAWRIPPRLPVVLFASKLVARKRAADLLEAQAVLRQRGLEACLVIAGSGDQKPALESMIRERAIPDVLLPGFVNQSRLPELYAIADVFVLPSEDEPWGLVLNEAMCAAVPAVVADGVGAAADLVIEGETGYTYPTGDAAALADRLACALASPQETARLGAGARARVLQWSYEECLAGVKAALAHVAPR